MNKQYKELAAVRAQRAELDKREKAVVANIANMIQAERQRLDQIEAELHPDADVIRSKSATKQGIEWSYPKKEAPEKREKGAESKNEKK